MDIEALEKIQQLKDKGIITETDFQQQKEKILNRDIELRNNYNQPSGCQLAFFILVIVIVLICTFISKFIFLIAMLN